MPIAMKTLPSQSVRNDCPVQTLPPNGVLVVASVRGPKPPHREIEPHHHNS